MVELFRRGHPGTGPEVATDALKAIDPEPETMEMEARRTDRQGYGDAAAVEAPAADDAPAAGPAPNAAEPAATGGKKARKGRRSAVPKPPAAPDGAGGDEMKEVRVSLPMDLYMHAMWEAKWRKRTVAQMIRELLEEHLNQARGKRKSGSKADPAQ